ncbi:hypothetical protein [Mangrovimonas cancribranchiae]|uniref:Lysylphosphatidylglycerol synthase TM region n=1 Tax=Mangrovimonas cancribranchiae TaxID=3080055 RepID=A0AAU6P771_9FLAO
MRFGALPYKTKQFFIVLIKLSIVVGAFYFIYQKITLNSDLSYHTFINYLEQHDVFSIKHMAFLVFLSSLNWFFDILKWQTLTNPIKQISIKNATQQTLGALTASLFTPNRIGEYGAKVLYFEPPLRKRVVLINFLGNITQMGVTTILGCIGLTLFFFNYDIDFSLKKVLRFLTIVILISFMIGFGLKKYPFKIKGQSFSKIKAFFKDYPKNNIYKASTFSLLRYAVFSFQFYWILLIFGVDISYPNAMIVISSMYLLASIIPSISIFDVVIKGSVAVYLFTSVGVNDFIILSTVMLMWLLNFALPSVFGSYYVLNFKLPESD